MIFCQESDCRPSLEESAAESFRCVTFCKYLFTDQLLIHIMGRVTDVTRAALPRAPDGKMSDTRVRVPGNTRILSVQSNINCEILAETHDSPMSLHTLFYEK